MKQEIQQNSGLAPERFDFASLIDRSLSPWFSSDGRSFLLWLLAAAVIVLSLPGIRLEQMNDLGLISVLPAGIILAVVMVNAGFIYLLTRPTLNEKLLLAYAVLFIFLLTSITVPVQAVPRFAVTWRHAGVVDYIMDFGSINPRIDAYFNWPIFFTLGALFTQASGLKSILQVADWATLLYNLLYLGPLMMILQTATQDRRKVWLGAWLFFVFNWIGQDYFSPQGINYFLYLTVLAALLHWFRNPQPAGDRKRTFARLGRLASLAQQVDGWLFAASEAPEALTGTQRRGLLWVLLLVMALIVSSHQLTPFALLLGISALALFNRIRPRYLPIIMGVMILAWFSLLAAPYLSSRIEQMMASVGQLDDALTVNVVERLAGSPGHTLVVRWRMLLTIGLWGIAAAGMLRRYLKGHADTSMVLLAGAPFVLIGMQPYGGEMLMRVFLFNLPFMVFFVADITMTLFKPEISWRRASVLLVTLLFLSAGYYLARYGNERMDQYTAKEVSAIQYVYDHAEPGSLIAAATRHLPIKYQDYQMFPQAFFEKETVSGDIDSILERMQLRKYPEVYLILTKSQRSNLEMFFSFGPEEVDQFVEELLASGRFEMVYENEDGQVFTLLNP